MDEAELSGWLRLALTRGVGPSSARRLLAAFGLPDQILAQPVAVLQTVVGAAQAQALTQIPEGFEAALARTWAWLQAEEQHEGVRVVHRLLSLADPGYPQALLQIADPPLLLYTLGPAHVSLGAVPSTQALAVVGSRNPTPQGASDARLFARHLAQSGFCIVSGLALGIDGAAHEGALEGCTDAVQVATVAVVGTGLDRVYPARHRALAHRIAARGLIVSEFPLGTPPLTPNFPRRNRLIAGLTQGTLVVEAALASGSLITARLAAEQGREVFAIPGSIHAPQSRGCHALIRQGAKLVESAQDILEELPGWTAAAHAQPESDRVMGGDELETTQEEGLLAQMGYGPVSLDALCARTGYDVARLQVALLELELAGSVGRLPGGLYQRVAAA